MKLTYKIAACALMLSTAATAQQGLGPERDAMIQSLLAQLQTCDQAGASQKISVCEASLSNIESVQPTIEYEHEAMLSFLAEVAIRSNLSDAYFAQQNLNKHCENVEKMWAVRAIASGVSGHPAFAEIDRQAQIKRPDVQACRQMGGTPEWGAPL